MRIFIILPLLYALNTLIIDIPNTDAFSSPTFIGNNETDRLALLDIKSKITLDAHGVLSSWNDSVNFCLWEGVTCGHRHKRVIGLNLTAKGLVGTLSPFVGNLSFLHKLTLANNTFKGLIPPQVGRLVSLQTINLEYNEFEGEIPSNISGCLQLTSLNLYVNNLIGNIPSELSLLSRLQLLGLDGNSFTGKISPLSNLTSLQELYLGPGFRGTIPDFIGNFKDLTVLALGGNSFTGKIPPSLYNLSKLQMLSLPENQLEGSLPPNLGFYFPQLKWLQIRDNHFSGPIPFSLSNLSNLEFIELGNNNFSGKFLLDGRYMKNLSKLHIGGANLGTVEPDDLKFISSLVNCSKLLDIDIGDNNFGGVLPQSIVNLSTELLKLAVNKNKITGNIPSTWSNYPNLQLLYLNHNHFTGTIPHEIGQLPKLQMADFSDNQLSGTIPLSLGNLSWLSYLDLSLNKLKGTIPATLSNCTSLQYLYLSNNNLVGIVPHQLFQASTILELDFSYNHLQGSIPSEFSEFVNLVFVDMGNNHFSGNIASNLAQCLALTYLYLNGNFFIGPIPPSFSLLKGLQVIDLSSNKLSGQVPGYFSNFSSLVLLNLSFNNLEGEIPTRGVFSNMSAISLAGNNKLCGGIPELKLQRCPNTETNRNKKSHALIIIAISICCVLTGLAIVSSIYLLQQRRRRKASSSAGVEFMLDMTAHVGDFGLVKLLPEVSEQLHNSSSIGVRGTVGYAAPEYGLGTSVSVAGDVYSYGIILLEMMTAKNPTNSLLEGDMNLHKFAESALPDRVLEIIDPKLRVDDDVDDDDERNRNLNETRGVPECAFECITTLIMAGVKCSSELPQDRLDMKDVIRQLLSQRPPPPLSEVKLGIYCYNDCDHLSIFHQRMIPFQQLMTRNIALF